MNKLNFLNSSNLKIFFIKKSYFVVILFSLFLFSCIQAPASKRLTTSAANTTNTNTSGTNLPTFKDGYNYFQNGGTIYTSTFSFQIDYADAFYFRGKDVDTYIRNVNQNSAICLVARFQQSTVNKLVILALVPRSTYNYTNQSLEYYYSASPSDETTNQNNCLKTTLTNKLFSQYPTLANFYKIKSLCASGVCSTTGYLSEEINLFATSGNEVTNITTTSLSLNVLNSNVSNTTTGSTCVSNSECKNQGYDCCSGNQCVKDLQERSGVDKTTADYKQALQDILNSPSKIYNYPQYYFICGNNVTTPTTPSTTTQTPTTIAQQRVNTLGSYYSCVNKVHGESGQCTKIISNATTSIPYSVATDDRSFASTFTNLNTDVNTLVSIEKITYGEIVLYDYTTKSEADLTTSIYNDAYITINGQHNDDMTTGANVTLNSIPAGAASSDLVITYKNDASCTFVNSTLAKCEKYYTQGQNSFGSTIAEHRLGRVTDHYPASNKFSLPSYAYTNKTIKVEVDGAQLIQGTDWDVTAGSPNYVELVPNTNSGLRAQDTQIIKITFFAPISVMVSKLAALDSIRSTCSCTGNLCNLAPVKNNSGAITDYVCVYPPNENIIVPLSQKFYLSSKSVPVRFFDSSGTAQNAVSADTTAQELSPIFNYTAGDLAKPSNLNGYVGFNEIYGSLSYVTNSAKPPQMVNVKKGNSYDIFVDNGSYYSCAQCGADYYSQINKLFPSMQTGAGMYPMQFQTNRFATSSSMIRSDDYHFGRACFVPASMLPWSHFLNSDLQTQRVNRMKTQHFLFANGYQRDWFGFDYGSVIGSFDGVKWFAIGTNRRIKATSNKLFVAVNGYMGDLTIESTYTVSINESTLNPAGTGMVTTDIENDGAECQKYHQCATDNDCYASLGPDYTCSSINEITTSWPVFDDNGNEIPDSTAQNNVLISILGVSNPGKKCVYRGRGSLCTPNFNVVNLNSTFNQTQIKDYHACANNNYCQTFASSGSSVSKFNNRVNRTAKVVIDSTKDSLGLGAPVAMRPFSFNGQEPPRTEVLHNLNGTKALAMCIPGKNPELDTFLLGNNTAPDSYYYPGDRLIGNGQTEMKTNSADLNYLSSCPVFDSTSNYYYKTGDPTLSNKANTSLIWDAGSQNISTNAITQFKQLFTIKGLTFNSLTANSNSIINSLQFQTNTCLRAPGASCNTDLDCAPSKPLTDKLKLLNSSDSAITPTLNSYEIKFWQEPLVCSQAAEKTVDKYDPKNNRCCREVGSVISIGQQSTDVTSAAFNLKTTSIPGINIPLNDPKRYSRVASYYKENNTDTTKYPALKIPAANQCSGTCFDYASLTNQYNSLNIIGTKTSCSNSWVRSFSNGTHNWAPNKFQAIKASTFSCYNFGPNKVGGFKCDNNETDENCKFIQTSPTGGKANAVMSLLGKMELMGIPQIAIPNEADSFGPLEGDLSCKSNPLGQNQAYPGDTIGSFKYMPPTLIWSNFTINNANSYPLVGVNFEREIQVNPPLGTKFYYSAGDTTNFNSAYKTVFKSDEIVACSPAGTVMKSASDLNLCCSGFINQQNMQCALPDFIDISVYTNKYVSSEGNSLSESLFDTDGYIKDPSYVAQLACAKKMCASKKITFGVLVSRLKIPGLEDNSSSPSYYRFLQGNTKADDPNGFLTLFGQGLKINSHAYCAPANLSQGPDGEPLVVNCQ